MQETIYFMRTGATLDVDTDHMLRQTLLEYQAIMDNASLGITFTRERMFMHCNERFSEMFGWPNHDLVGQSTDIVYPSREAFEAVSILAQRTLGKGQRLDAELLLKKRNGGLFWCRTLANAIDPADHSKGTIFIVEDITERKKADEARQHLLLEYKAILDNASLGITFTRGRNFLHCNERFAEMFGWTSSDLVGQPTDIVYSSKEAYEELSRIAMPILGSGQRLDTEVLGRRRDGSTFWCRVLGRAIDPSDHDKGTIFIAEDITERKNAQEALLWARDALERRVQERTAELANANVLLQAEIAERRHAEEQIRYLAHHDALTGLPNRRLLEDRLGQAIGMAKRNSAHVAIQFIDLDRFKPINDRLGHRVGDMLLQAVARRLRGLLREADTVSRVGGDEFVIVLPDMNSETAAAETAQKVLQALSQPYVIEGNELGVTPSIGISIYPKDGIDAETLISRADAAMYHAKQMGRGNFQLFAGDFVK
jgi:diguanylate cyclase (GGDEF)-like protein/PAS domain S-box-containing protein